MARVLLAAVVLMLACSCWVALPCAAAHEGCGQHSPLVQQQQQLLHRRLQQLRAAEAAAADKQDKQQQGSGGSKSAGRSGSSGSVGPAELRIGAVYQLKGVSSRDAAIIERQLVPTAIKVLQRYIQVIRPSGPPVVPKAFYSDSAQGKCLIGKVDDKLQSAVSSHDLSLYITADSVGCVSGMIAVATACEVDPLTKRPLLGSLNICPAALQGLDSLSPGSESHGFAMGRLVEVVVHEIIHVLGFGSNHYEDWRGPDGQVYGRKKVVIWSDDRPYLATPKVTRVAREYFGCPSLPGAPLEDEGPAFSAASHFEYRLLQREMMSPARPIDRSRARLSAFTLAALEDSGWYKANYNDAEPLDWGRGAGCDFVTNSCWDYITKNPNQPYYCGKGSVNQTRCTASARGWGVCRSSAFTDGCLLVGKYSTDTGAAVKDDVAASGADGRAAACYSPPQLEALQKNGGGGNLLPLLGGSFSSSANDICYNLIAPPGSSSGSSSKSDSSRSACAIPEDCPPAPAAQQGGRTPLAASAALETLEKAPAVFTFYEHDVKAGGSSSSNGKDSDAARAAACVNVATGLTSGSSSSSSEKGSSSSSSKGSSGKHRRRGLMSSLLAPLTAADLSGFLHHHHPQQQQQQEQHTRRRLAAATAAAARQSFTAVVSAPNPSDSKDRLAAACTSSPVLCFKSTCDTSGQLLIEVQLPQGGSSSSSSSSSTKFGCPSGRTVDLSKVLPGRYLMGSLQCPSNHLVCENLGCGDCSPSGGFCFSGKCVCHMERFGPGCKQTLVPKL